MSKPRIEKLEALQNNALRLVFKIYQANDHVKNENLLARANIQSVTERHKMLRERYFENAIISSNPIVIEIFKNYKDFKERDLEDPSIAINDENHKDLIINNRIEKLKKEKYMTILCDAPKQFIFEDFSEMPGDYG